MDFNIIAKYFLLFIIYSFAGWVMETILVSMMNKRLVDRGFLIGPYCPIYGCGALLIILFLNKFSFDPLLLFVMTVILCGILEYGTSYFMEKIFKARWWDYSHKKFNLNGRICLDNLIAFGVMGLAVTYFLNPYFEKWIGYLDEVHLQSLSLILWTIFVADFVLSTIVVYGFRKITEKVNRERVSDNTEQITKMVRQIFSEKSFLHRRFIDAYPRIEAIKIKMKEIKNKIEDVTNEAKGKVTEKVNDVKEVVSEKTEVLKTNIQKGTRRAKVQIRLGKKHIVRKFKTK